MTAPATRWRQVGWLWAVSQGTGFNPLWKAVFGRVADPAAPHAAERSPVPLIEWLDDQAGGPVRLEETLGAELGYRVMVPDPVRP